MSGLKVIFLKTSVEVHDDILLLLGNVFGYEYCEVIRIVIYFF